MTNFSILRAKRTSIKSFEKIYGLALLFACVLWACSLPGIAVAQEGAGAPIVESLSHPNPDLIYAATSVTLTWTPDADPLDIDGYYYAFNQSRQTTPTLLDSYIDKASSSLTIFDVIPGSHYFHLRSAGVDGFLSDTATYRVNIASIWTSGTEVFPTTLTISNVLENNSLPYLVDFTFSLRDPDGHVVVYAPDVLGYEALEDTTPISELETAKFLVPGSNSQMSVFMVLDYTNSVAATPGAIEAMEAASKSVIDSLTTGTKIGVSEFHREDRPTASNIVTPVTSNKDYVKLQIDGIMENYVKNFHSASRCWDAVYDALTNPDTGLTTSTDEQRILIIMSDGRDESSTKSVDDITSMAVKNNTRIYCIGFGAELDEDVLKNIADNTNGQYYKASNDVNQLAEVFAQISYDLQGQYSVRWATLKRSGGKAFIPGLRMFFKIEDIGADSVILPDPYVSANTYDPTSNAGDVLGGLLRRTVSPPINGETDMYLRAQYVPRYITRIQLKFKSTFPYTVNMIPEIEGGLGEALGWTLTTATVAGAPGYVYLRLQSPNPQDIATALPYGAFGSLLKFHFSGLRSLADLQNTSIVDIIPDNSIYSINQGQYFNLEDLDIEPEPALSLSPITGLSIVGMAGGPFAEPTTTTYRIENSGNATMQWAAFAGVNWITVGPTSGTLAPGAWADVTAGLNAKSLLLTRGTYTGSISFVNNTNALGNAKRFFTVEVKEAYPLVVVSTSGTVTVDPVQAQYFWGSTITLTATPTTDTLFSHWSSEVPAADAEKNPLVFTITEPTTLTAFYGLDRNAIVIDVQPEDAPWTLVDATTVTHSGVGYQVLWDMPPGNAKLTWGDLPGYYTPLLNPVEDFLTTGGTLFITANYLVAPETPINPSPPDGATNVSLATSLMWGELESAQSFDLYFWTSTTKPLSPTVIDVPTNYYILPFDLTTGTVYNWQVITKNEAGETSSSQWSFTTVAHDAATTVPMGVQASDGLFTGYVRVSWPLLNGVSHYRVYRSDTPSSVTAMKLSPWIAVNSFLDTTAVPGVRYYYWVKSALSDLGDQSGAFSKTDPGWRALMPPTGLTATDDSDVDKIVITWDAVDGASYYQVYRGDMPGDTPVALSGWLTDLTYGDTSVVPGVTHYYWVTAAVNNSGGMESGFSDPPVFGSRKLSPPTNVSASDGLYADHIEIVWDAVEGASHYRLYRSTSSTLATAAAITTWRSGMLSRDDTSATPGITYYYWVRAAISNTGSHATEYSLSDTGIRLVPIPTGLTATDGVYSDRIEISWDAVAGASHYQLYRGKTTDTATALPVGIWMSETSYVDSTIDIGMDYYYRVRAATDATGAQAGEFSVAENGWATLEGAGELKNYKVTYKNALITVDAETNMNVLTSNEKSTLKIQLLKKLPKNMETRSGLIYILNSRGIKSLQAQTNFGKIYTEAPIASIDIKGALQSLSTKGVSISDIYTYAIASVKMNANIDSSAAVDHPPIARTNLVSSSYSSFKTKIALNGIVLENMDMPGQSIASLLVSSSKGKGANNATIVSYGGIEGGILNVQEIVNLKAKGASIAPVRLITVKALSNMKITSSLGTFTVGPKGAKRTEMRPGDITGQMYVAAKSLSVSAKGGDIITEGIYALNEIGTIEAKPKSYRSSLGKQSHGGDLNAAFIVCGASAVPQPKFKGIRSVRGVTVSANFYVGATNDTPTDVFAPAFVPVPTYTGNIKGIKTLKGSVAPIISGTACVLDGEKLRKALDKKGNAMGFVIYDANNPMP